MAIESYKALLAGYSRSGGIDQPKIKGNAVNAVLFKQS
jgi:hypothetical protein